MPPKYLESDELSVSLLKKSEKGMARIIKNTAHTRNSSLNSLDFTIFLLDEYDHLLKPMNKWSYKPYKSKPKTYFPMTVI